MDPWSDGSEWRAARRLAAGFGALLALLWFVLAFLSGLSAPAYVALLVGSALLALGLAREWGLPATAGALILGATVGIGLVSPVLGWRVLPFPVLLLLLAAYVEVRDPSRAAAPAWRVRLK